MRKVYFCILTALLFSCNKQENSGHKLFINTTSVKGATDNQTRKDTVTVYDAEYFEVSLERYSNDSLRWFEAKREIELSGSGDFITIVFLKVAQEDGKPVRFSNSTDFLNYMSSKKYELFNQTNSNYTLKRKP